MRSNHLKQWKSFRIYSKPSKKLIAIEQKVWYWPAFFFTWFWSLLNRLWLVSVITIVVCICIEYLLGTSVFERCLIYPHCLENFIEAGNSGIEYYPFQQTAYWTAWLLISVAFGLRGKEWREQKLLERGYEPTYIKAESRELAILQFKSESTDEETNKPQESVMSMSKDLIKRKIQESASSDKKVNSDYVEELKEAKALLDDDLINKEDYEKIKKKIIEDL